ncbi:MAG TPA: sigma-70 family RNA polymerase sigma factor [Burkholderiales bacterium]|jgi:RNA polymerase sigma-70 factor (ECF subfamily)
MEGTDEELMAAYRDGDAGAFDALYARHKGPLFRYVLRGVRSASRAVAEELYQEIWIRVIEARARWQPSARFTTWLYTIAHNRMVDYWRRKELAEAPEAADEPPAGPDSDPAHQAQARQVLGRVAQALAGLPPAQREAFLLHEEAGMTALEIAAATRSDPEAVKSRLRYAFAKLKEAAENG